MAGILIVEDDAFIRELVEITINDWGHHTFLASDGDEALLILHSARHIDLLFTDIYLKTAIFGGCELAHRAMDLRPKLRVLYTTGNLVSDKMKASFVEGSLYLRKPYTTNQLECSLDDLLAA